MGQWDGQLNNLEKSLLGYNEEELLQAIELLFFAYRDFTGEADVVLSKFGFGRAHHRAIYFIARNPKISVSDLIDILKITKQSLSRVLTRLIVEGYVSQKTDKRDRRRRLLQLSQKGMALERQLTNLQCLRIIKAIEIAGVESASGFRSTLRAMIDTNDLQRFSERVELPRGNLKPGLSG